MASLDLSDFERTAREIVRAAMLEGTLSNLTIRKVRDRIEILHELEKDSLLTPQYKRCLKAVIQDASAQAKMEMKDEEARFRPRHSMADERDAADSVSHALTSRGQAGKYKSAEFVEDSSELEELPEDDLTRVSPETKFPRGKIKSKEPRAPLKSPLKKRRKTVANDNESMVYGHTLTNSGSTTKNSDESDNDMASLPDDSPQPKKKARTSGDKSRIKKSKDEASDKHNATIKRLKSLVHACGVRKPWAKVFKDIPKPTQQIKKLREILTELGMTGRMSLEQAKRIKAEREIAQELADVKSFEQSMLKSSRSRIAESNLRPSLEPTDFGDEDSEDDDGLKHRRRKIPQSRNIDAFIGSESEDD